MELKVKANTLQATKFLKGIKRKQLFAAQKGLNRVSNMAVEMITTRIMMITTTQIFDETCKHGF